MRSSDAGAQRAYPSSTAKAVAIHAPFPRTFATPLTIFSEVDVERDGDAVTIRATRVVDADDPHLRAHFPELTIFPGVFLIEALRQAVKLAVDHAAEIEEVRSVRFLAPLVPGDTMQLEATVSGEPGARPPAHPAPAWRGAGRPPIDVAARITRGDGTAAATMKVRFEVPSAAPDQDRVRARAFLPHGHPMLLVDRVVSLEPGRAVTAIKAVSGTDPCYRSLPRDAAPQSLAYPTSLLLESFGQTAALLWLESATAGALEHDGVVILASAHSCRIEGAAYPGDVLTHCARLTKMVGDTLVAEGETSVGVRRIATIESMIATVRPRAAMAETRESPRESQ